MEGAAFAEENATVWRRFMAASYEAVILFAVVFFFGYAFSALFQLKFEGRLTPGLVAFQIWMVAVLGIYFAWFWSNGRRTLPMKTMAVKLVDRQGAPLTTGRAILRYLLAGLIYLAIFASMKQFGYGLGLLLPLPFFWALIDKQGRSIYDVWAGTRLVLSDPRS